MKKIESKDITYQTARTYICVAKVMGKVHMGVSILKHITFSPYRGKSLVSRWKWVLLDGHQISNVLIDVSNIDCCGMYKTPEEAIDAVQLTTCTTYEFKDQEDLLLNIHKVME